MFSLMLKEIGRKGNSLPQGEPPAYKVNPLPTRCFLFLATKWRIWLKNVFLVSPNKIVLSKQIKQSGSYTPTPMTTKSQFKYHHVDFQNCALATLKSCCYVHRTVNIVI